MHRRVGEGVVGAVVRGPLGKLDRADHGRDQQQKHPRAVAAKEDHARQQCQTEPSDWKRLQERDDGKGDSGRS